MEIHDEAPEAGVAAGMDLFHREMRNDSWFFGGCGVVIGILIPAQYHLRASGVHLQLRLTQATSVCVSFLAGLTCVVLCQDVWAGSWHSVPG